MYDIPFCAIVNSALGIHDIMGQVLVFVKDNTGDQRRRGQSSTVYYWLVINQVLYHVTLFIDNCNTGSVSQHRFSEFLKGFGPVQDCIKNVRMFSIQTLTIF
jgi:hypothetical protein